ncbi:hypothetical protein ICE98_00674 [Lactococcus lactis]|nr:hypothetical protein [Lactococcus lactis]
MTARNVAKELGIDEVHANLLPEDKARIVMNLNRQDISLLLLVMELMIVRRLPLPILGLPWVLVQILRLKRLMLY